MDLMPVIHKHFFASWSGTFLSPIEEKVQRRKEKCPIKVQKSACVLQAIVRSMPSQGPGGPFTMSPTPRRMTFYH